MPEYVVTLNGHEQRRYDDETEAEEDAEDLRRYFPNLYVQVVEEGDENPAEGGQSELPVEDQPSVEIQELPPNETVTIDQGIAREAAAEIEDLLATDRIAAIMNTERLREFCWQVREDISEIDYDNNPNQ